MFSYDNISILVTLLNIGLAGFVIFLERRNVAATWAWLMVLLFLPIVGFVAYVFFAQNLSKRKMYKLERETEMRLAGIIEAQRSEFKERALPFRDPVMNRYRDLMYMNLKSSSAVFTQSNDVRVFTDGREKFETLLAEIREAKESIHLLYYIVKDDALGNRILDALIEKAEAGVEVRFLYDQIGSYRLSSSFFQRLTKAGGHAAAFFPSKIPYLNIRVNYRNHRKLVVIDGKYGYIGGFNIGDEYLGLDPRLGYWRDTHLRIVGTAVLQMQIQFMLDWNLASHAKITADEKYFPASGLQGDVGVQIVSSGPNFSIEHTRNVYLKMIHSAKERVYIQTPYFIPDESVLTALKMAVLSGVDVRIMIPGRPDKRMVYWASFSYLGDLLQLGMRCFLYDRGFLHAKTIVVDGEIASVGTANFDIRSFRLNFEVNAVLYDTDTAGRLRSIFEEDMTYCRELTFEEYQNRSKGERFRESCIRLLSPIL
ncbi:cardiolipin synthase [Paenibacillus antri]|uniref:Cardiolipin synthase n=1 Tax=Paenibacillus antri TaxID=2582848 RepID=A0A5R9GBS1_9BACL|nr:cardiolipin synthase [Paenibacillus antri]TLS53191.1 cardiolipin synthase [Paenibacillus antri]